MKRWQIPIITFYVVAMLLFIVPVIARLCIVRLPDTYVAQLVALYFPKDAPFYFLHGILFFCILGQLLLLFLPVDEKPKKSRPRRKLVVPVLGASLAAGLLNFTMMMSVMFLLLDEDSAMSMLSFEFLPKDWQSIMLVLAPVGSWLFWAAVFWHLAGRKSQSPFSQRVLQYLLAGSVLELLVAISAHVVSRRRGDCCAPFFSFWGIVAGVGVAFMCFGPGIVFLFTKRVRQKKKP